MRELARILALAGLKECPLGLRKTLTHHQRSLSLALTSGLNLALVVFSPHRVPAEGMEVVLEQPAGRLPTRILLDLVEGLVNLHVVRSSLFCSRRCLSEVHVVAADMVGAKSKIFKSID